MEKPDTDTMSDDHKVYESEMALPAKSAFLSGELAEDPDEGLSEEEKAQIVSDISFLCHAVSFLLR
jgi:hypothetical protein